MGLFPSKCKGQQSPESTNLLGGDFALDELRTLCVGRTYESACTLIAKLHPRVRVHCNLTHPPKDAIVMNVSLISGSLSVRILA